MPLLMIVLLLFPVIDIVFSLWLVAKHGWVLILLILSSGLGVMMLRNHRLIVLQTLVSQLRKKPVTTLFWLARYYIAAVLFIFPGILTDILAVVCLLPWQGKKARPTSAADVIEAEFTRDITKPTLPKTHAPDENH